MSRVLRYISIKLRTTKEIENYLRTKLRLPEGEISKILDYLKDAGFLDDEFVKDAFIKSRTSKGFGAKYIKQKLLSRGIDVKEDINTDIDKMVSIVLRRYDPTRSKEDKLKLKAKIYRFLSYRGLKYDEINEVMKRVFNKEFNQS